MPTASEATRYAKRKETWQANPSEKERQLASWRENSRNYRKRKRPGTTITQSPEYRDIRSIRRAWQGLSIRNPLRQIGLDAMDKISQNHYPLPVIDISFQETVTVETIFLGGQTGGVYRNVVANMVDGRVTFGEFMAGWNALEANLGVDVTEYSQIPYAAVGVVATAAGLGSYGVQIPECLTELDVLVRGYDDGGFQMLTNVTPAGTIIDGHFDGVATGSVLVVLFGTNVVFTWPPTPANLKRMESRHGVHGPITLPFLMDDMSDMSVTILNKNQGIQLDCGTIYAILSPNNSAMARWEFVKSAWMDSETVKNVLFWEANLIVQRRKTPLAVFSQDEGEATLERDLSMWEALAEKLRINGADTGVYQRILQMINIVPDG
jgi:hypothetical protein